MNAQKLKVLLDEKYQQFNTPAFIQDDPISIPHGFDKKEDIEISAFFTAIIAWGRRDMIIKNAFSLIERMDMAPHDFVLRSDERDLQKLSGFVHRTFNDQDLLAITRSLKIVYQKYGGLEKIFSDGISHDDLDVYNAIVHARTLLSQFDHFPNRSHKHLANPTKGSSAKRINMFLRWMVRRDEGGVDFGIWENISPHQLICPLDVHTGNVARHFGLLERKQNDWKAAAELTQKLRAFCPEDPVRYDFSLFGLGVYEGIGRS